MKRWRRKDDTSVESGESRQEGIDAVSSLRTVRLGWTRLDFDIYY